jgi:hypothetical protein
MPVIPATQEVEIRRTVAWGQLGQEVSKTFSTNRLGMAVHTYNPSYLGGIGRRITFWDAPRQRHENLSKKQLKSSGGESVQQAQGPECKPQYTKITVLCINFNAWELILVQGYALEVCLEWQMKKVHWPLIHVLMV